MFILILLLYAGAAASFTLAKWGLFYAPPVLFVAIRMTIAGILLLGYLFVRYRKIPFIRRSDLLFFGITSIIQIYCAFIFDFLALRNLTSFKGAFIYNLSPFFAAFFSYHHFAEALTWKKVVGLLIGFVGFLPELMRHAPNETLAIGFLSRAEIYMILSVAAASYGWTLFRVLLRRGYTAIQINGYTMLIGGILAFITSALVESPDISNVPMFSCVIITIILVSNIFTFNLNGYLLRQYTVTFLLFCGMITPLFAAIFGMLFLQEWAGLTFYISMAMVALGLAIFYSEELRQGYIVKK